jgi:hypothetical protein
VVSRPSSFDHLSLFHGARAVCGDGEVVVGGGAQVYPDNESTRPVALTELVPLSDADGLGHDGYAVTAKAVTVVQVSWRVTAFAVCAQASSVPTQHIVKTPTDLSTTSTVQATAAACPPGERVLGSGADVFSIGTGSVVLQVARPDGPGGIARVQGHVAPGFTGSWKVDAYAICAATPPGYKVAFGGSHAPPSETRKEATVVCGGQQPLGLGGAISNIAPGNASLQSIQPFSNSSSSGSKTVAVENTPTDREWENIATTAVCVDR